MYSPLILKNRREQSVTMMMDCLVLVETKSRNCFPDVRHLRQAFVGLKKLWSRPKGIQIVEKWVNMSRKEFQLQFMSQLQKYDQWKDKYQILLMTVQPLVEEQLTQILKALRQYQNTQITPQSSYQPSETPTTLD